MSVQEKCARLPWVRLTDFAVEWKLSTLAVQFRFL